MASRLTGARILLLGLCVLSNGFGLWLCAREGKGLITGDPRVGSTVHVLLILAAAESLRAAACSRPHVRTIIALTAIGTIYTWSGVGGLLAAVLYVSESALSRP